ncbi:MAG: OsmC family protein [Fuerstiella sp.]
MNTNELRQIQTPLKALYTESPAEALAEMRAFGVVDLSRLSCRVKTPFADSGITESGLHPKAGGDGRTACSGDMLLQSLVACSGVTFAAVATAMELEISAASIEARGTMDFRGTLGVDRNTAVGLTSVELIFDVVSSEADDRIDKLIQLTERYCVVLQTLRHGATCSARRGSVTDASSSPQ